LLNSFGIVQKVRPDDFDRHLSVERCVGGPANDPQTAFSVNGNSIEAGLGKCRA
jgi:hypothetical protein